MIIQKLKKGSFRKKVGILITFLSVYFCMFFLLEKTKTLIDLYILMPLIGVSIEENFPIAGQIFILVIGFIISLITSIIIVFLIRPSKKDFISIKVKSEENIAMFTEYLDYIHPEKTWLLPDFSIASFYKKMFGAFYVIIVVVPVIDNNVFVSCIIGSIPFIYFATKGIIDKKKRKIDIILKIIVLTLFVILFSFSSHVTIKQINLGELNSRIIANTIIKASDLAKQFDFTVGEENTFNVINFFDKKNVEAYKRLGSFYASSKNLPMEFILYEKLLKDMPSEAYGYCQLGLLYKNQGDIVKALHMFKNARMLDEQYWPAYYEEASILISKNLFKEASNLINMTDTNAKDYDYRIFDLNEYILRNKGEYKQALEVLSRRMELGVMTADNFAEKGFLHLKLGNIDGALINIEKAIAINTREQKYKYIKGIILLTQNQGNRAIEVFKDMLKSDPSYERAKAGIALSDLHRGKIKSAKEKIELAIQETCQDSEVWYIMASIMRENQLYQVALENINKAIDLNQNQSNYKSLKAQILMDLGNDVDATTLIEEAYKMDSHDYMTTYVYGNYYMQKNDFKNASLMFAKSIESNAYNARAYISQALVENILGNTKFANELIYYAMKINPDDYFVYTMRANIYQARGLETLANEDKNIATNLYNQ